MQRKARSARHWLRWAMVFNVAVGAASVGRAQSADGTVGSGLAAPSHWRAPGFHLLDDTSAASRALVDKQNQITFAVSVVGIMGAHQLDPAARDFFGRQRRLGDYDRLGNEVLGTGIPGLLLAGGFWAWGAGTENSYEVHAGQAQLEAIVGTAITVFTLKGAVRRDRPDNSDQYSFPSGHTSTVAASAIVLQEFYGWKAGVPMFLLTALTAASRMSVDAHWFSDTVAGAGVGVLIGHAFSRSHLDLLEKKRDEASKVARVSRPMILPVFSPGGGGLAVVVSY
jgi:hypothetical protein